MVNRAGQQLGNYRFVRRLGQGAFADVYLGEHVYLKSYAALKVLHTILKEEDVERFLAEAQTLVGLRHPNIVRVLEFIYEQNTPMLVIDYAPGGTARQQYQAGSRLPLATTVAYIQQVANALQYAHNHSIIHRDVKPDNILFDSDQHILLGDFGLALLTPPHEMLSTQEFAGTIPYMAPEQLDGKPTFATDQYALAIVTYEWLCGTYPFEGSAMAIINQHINALPPPLREKRPDLPVAVENVVLKALAKDPQQRYTSVQAFAGALTRASQQNAVILDDDTQPLNALQFISASSLTTASSLITDTTPTRQSPQTPRRIFMTTAPADEVFAARLRADLEARGVIVTSAPEAGAPDQENALREAVGDADVILVVISPSTRSSRIVKEQLRIAGMYQQRMVFVRAAGDDIAAELPEAWGRTAMIDLIDARGSRYLTAIDEIMTFLKEVIPVTSPEVSTLLLSPGEPRNPFKGLLAFTESDAVDFFGRDALILELAETIDEMLAAEHTATPSSRLLTVIGPSGSGKSSTVRAGLLPELRKSALPGSEKWVYLEPIVPGHHPLEALVLALAPQLPNRSLRSIRRDLDDDSTRGLHLLATQLIKQADSRVVLTIDQFEELFAQTISEQERLRFIDLLVTAATEPRGPLVIVLTLRADFYDRPMHYPELSSLIEAHQTSVRPMNPHELRAIIERPALLPNVQVIFDDNLVGDLLFEAQGQIGALPLLEFTLDQLFRLREDHRLTRKAYRQIGGVKGALAKHAESTYASLRTEEHRQLARALFLRLIDPGISEQDATRRRAPLSELSLPDQQQTVLLREVADAFVAARLLTTNEKAGITTIEVSHEALIRKWARLADWLSEAREDIVVQQTINDDAMEWTRRGSPEDRLYRGTQLVEAQVWAARNMANTDEIAFLKASVAEHKRQEVAEQSRQARELKLKRQTVNRLRGLVALLSLFLVASIVFASLIGVSLQQNMQLLQMSRSRALAANAIISLSQNELDRALLLSVKANQVADTYEARNSLLTALEYSPHIVTMLHHESSINVNTLAFGSDGSMFVSSDDNRVYVWDTSTKAYHTLPLDLKTIKVRSVAFSPDGQLLVTSSSDEVRLWNLKTGSQLEQLDGKINTPPGILPPTYLAFSSNGMFLASGRCHAFASTPIPTCVETDVIVWNMLTKQQIGPPCVVRANMTSIALSPDGMTLAYGSDTNVGLCEIATGMNSPLSGSAGTNSVAFSPDGKRLAFGGNARTIQLWDMVGRQLSGSSLVGQTEAITSLAFSRNSDILASGSMDKTIWLWDVAGQQPIGSPLVGHTDAITSLAFSPKNNMLVSGSANGIILLWNIDADSPIGQQSGKTGGAWSAVFSSDGTTVYTGSDDGQVFPYDVETGKPLDPLKTVTLYPPRKLKPGEQENLSAILSLALSRDGQVLAVGRRDGTILLWNTKTKKMLAHFQQTNLLNKLVLSPDGQTVASVDDGDTILLWNVAKKRASHVLAPPNPKYQLNTPSLDFSTDGKTLATGGCARMRNGGTCVQGQIVLWNVETGKPFGPPLLGQPSELLDASFSDVAFSPDGQTLASSSQAGILLWNISTNLPVSQTLSLPTEKNYPGYSDYYDYILFSPDGKLLASYSLPGPSFSFVLWDVTERKPLAHAFHFPDTSTQGSIAFSPDGQQLASVILDASNNDIVTLWDITIAAWQKHACAIANRNLTKQEWTQFVSNEPYSKVCTNLPLPPDPSNN